MGFLADCAPWRFLFLAPPSRFAPLCFTTYNNSSTFDPEGLQYLADFSSREFAAAVRMIDIDFVQRERHRGERCPGQLRVLAFASRMPHDPAVRQDDQQTDVIPSSAHAHVSEVVCCAQLERPSVELAAQQVGEGDSLALDGAGLSFLKKYALTSSFIFIILDMRQRNATPVSASTAGEGLSGGPS